MTKRSSEPDEFLLAVAELAGLNPAEVVAGTLNVRIEREDGQETMTTVTAEVRVTVDPNAVIELAMKHDRIRPVLA